MRANYKRYETKTMKTEALRYDIGRQRAEGSPSSDVSVLGECEVIWVWTTCCGSGLSWLLRCPPFFALFRRHSTYDLFYVMLHVANVIFTA